MARPTLLTEELKDQLEVAAEAVYHYKFIAGLCGISVDALENYRKKDADLSARLEQARTRFIKNNVRKARPEFLLERLERDVFGDRKTIVVENPQAVLLEAYGVTADGKLIEGEDNDTKTDESVSDTSQDQT